MAVWTNFAALVASLASGKAFTDEKAQALAENVKAAFEGDATAVADGVTLLDAALNTGAATAAGTTWVGLRTAGLAAGAVGSYAMLRENAGSSREPGITLAGSSLRYINAAGDISSPNVTPSGTWRLMGNIRAGTTESLSSLWLRIS